MQDRCWFGGTIKCRYSLPVPPSGIAPGLFSLPKAAQVAGHLTSPTHTLCDLSWPFSLDDQGFELPAQTYASVPEATPTKLSQLLNI